jgi:hypothetical protein
MGGGEGELTNILSRSRTRDGKPGPVALSRAEARLDAFLKRLADVRVLDPACGSGTSSISPCRRSRIWSVATLSKRTRWGLGCA